MLEIYVILILSVYTVATVTQKTSGIVTARTGKFQQVLTAAHLQPQITGLAGFTVDLLKSTHGWRRLVESFSWQ